MTNSTGATTGGALDAAEAFACGDAVCFVVSCVGLSADYLQVIASFVPGPNVTALVRTSISVGCKVFV